MTPAELAAIASHVFGYGWQTKLAQHLKISDRSVRRFVSGDQPIPDGIALLVTDLATIPAPDPQLSDDDRDRICRRALFPHLNKLATDAQQAGWHVGEVLAAALAWTTQQIIDVAGHSVATEMINNARHEIDADSSGHR